MLTSHKLALHGVEFKFAASNPRSFEGYGAVFGNVDSYLDVIEQGAFKSILSAGDMPKMFFNHMAHQLPIGKWTHMQEDSKGLVMRGELTPGHTEAENVAAGMKHGTIDGLSIGYRLARSDYTHEGDIRRIKNISMLAEVSVVTFPANEEARMDVDSFKSSLESLQTVTDIERFLRDAGGFSKGLAVALVARSKAILGAGDPQAGKAEEKALAQLHERVAKLAQNPLLS